MEDISKAIEKSVPKQESPINKIISQKEENISKNFSKVPLAEDELKIRKEKILNFIKDPKIWVWAFLFIAIILGIYIRSLPLQDHEGNPGLWDVTTDTWTLGPDLDPWLFLRTAKTLVETGNIPEIDSFRNTPLGFENSKETMLLPYMIAGIHYCVNQFGEYPIEFAGAILPVIMFILTIIAFFLFVKEIFIKEEKESIIKANIIALISTFFMIVIPVFLSRTIAGIPEKESAGFFFMFLSFYLFLKAWKTQEKIKASIFGFVAGISTIFMGLIWGGVLYIFMSIALATFSAFIFNQIDRKKFLIYGIWFFTSAFGLSIFSGRTELIGMLTSISSGLAFVVFIIMSTHFLIWNTKISKSKYLRNSKIPKTILSVIIAITIIIIFSIVFFGPNFIIEKIKAINQATFTPTTGRWNTTVAENKQPYFMEWAGNFGPFVKNIPLMFWMFFIGSIVLFKKMLKPLRKKEAWILTGIYILFLFGIIFSRYAPHPAVLDGEGFLSRVIYFISVLSLFGSTIYYYFQYQKEERDNFSKINFSYLFLFAIFILTIISVRGAVRLIMILGPIAPIFVGSLLVESIDEFRQTKKEERKMIFGILAILILISSLFTFWSFYKTSKEQAYSFIPSSYNQQWQKAMQWVRENTPENAIFSHWWDYGYWVQSIGNRATVLDGGNAITYWNYLMGRLVLTGENQNDALEFLYNHNANYLLIDSTDIGKYGAFSSIGSDESYDRYSWIGTFIMDERQTRENANETFYVYTGGLGLDEDLVIQEENKQILLPAQKAGIGAIILTAINGEDGSTLFAQPKAVIVSQGKQYQVQMRYLSMGEKFLDFKTGINATAYVFPKLTIQENSVGTNQIGAIMFLSPRLMRGMLTQKYILNDPFNNFPNFKIAHVQSNNIVESLNSQGMNLPEFIYYQGIQGPIKIWKIEYTGKEKNREEYLDTDSSKYISWQL